MGLGKGADAAFGGTRNVGSPRSEVRTSLLFAFGSTLNFKHGKSSKINRIDLFVLNYNKIHLIL